MRNHYLDRFNTNTLARIRCERSREKWERKQERGGESNNTGNGYSKQFKAKIQFISTD